MHSIRSLLVTSAFALVLVATPLKALQPPRLVVYISVDQMREDYFERFLPTYSGGLKALYDQGTFFSNADLNYARSVTCLGHASLSTGAYPMTSGILENEWINPATRKSVYCVEDTAAHDVDGEGGGSSPDNLLVTAIGDWLKSASPRSKVIAVSAKDRAAILMGGKHPDCAFWYNPKNGHMVTSDYYTPHLPQWVREFNNADWIGHHVPAAWTKLLPDSVYEKEGPDDFISEAKWDSSSSFPHRFSPQRKLNQILTSPYGDLLVLDFARETIRQEELGERGVPDLLCLSLSDCDYVGHAFGPNSHEMMDLLFRLDAGLGSFFSFVDSTVGAANVLFVLSADHGVMPLPEYLAQHSQPEARRILFRQHVQPQLDSIDRAIRAEWGMKKSIFEQRGFLDYAEALRAGRDSLQFEERVGSALRKIDCIADVYFRRELLDPNTPQRAYLDKFKRSYYPGLGEDYQVRFREYDLVEDSPTGTSHGSVYRYDTHVPVVFWGGGTRAMKISREVHTVDIAPTLARIFGIGYPRTVDGAPLDEVR